MRMRLRCGRKDRLARRMIFEACEALSRYCSTNALPRCIDRSDCIKDLIPAFSVKLAVTRG